MADMLFERGYTHSPSADRKVADSDNVGASPSPLTPEESTTIDAAEIDETATSRDETTDSEDEEEEEEEYDEEDDDDEEDEEDEEVSDEMSVRKERTQYRRQEASTRGPLSVARESEVQGHSVQQTESQSSTTRSGQEQSERSAEHVSRKTSLILPDIFVVGVQEIIEFTATSLLVTGKRD